MNTTYFAYTEFPTEGIVQIPIALLAHHPDNPRKDLGDLTELADSIKAKGVMQNLTVVPARDQAGTGIYHVVIGNRRMEAAKIAGLKTLPCIIANMTAAEQVQTMLLENMQRVDLTPFEQAQGFQMMMDFGDSVEGISEKTGFSATTVRRRLKMAELDPKTLKEVSERQLTLGDFDRLDQRSPDEIDAAPYGADERFSYFDFGWVYFRQKKCEETEEKDDAFSTKEREREERYEKLEEASERAYDLRLAFIKGVSEEQSKRHFSLAIYAVAASARYTNYNNELDELFECESAELADAVAKGPYHTALFMGFVAKGGLQHFSTYNWQGVYTTNTGLWDLYDFLAAVGYDASPEEQALLDGTSALYATTEDLK